MPGFAAASEAHAPPTAAIPTPQATDFSHALRVSISSPSCAWNAPNSLLPGRPAMVRRGPANAVLGPSHRSREPIATAQIVVKSQLLYEIIRDTRQIHADEIGDFIRRVIGPEAADSSPAIDFAERIIDGIPGLLAEASVAAETRGIGLLVQPLLDHAAEYFLNPIDHASELAFGVPGLLDDAYLALRLIHLVQEVSHPLVRADVAGQLEFLRRLLGPDLVYELDAEAGRAVLRMALHIAAAREQK